MESSPRISIITACYNSRDTIAQTIESVLNQTYDNYEYIVIDGKSSDDTIELIRPYSEKFAKKNVPFTVISEKDDGIYDAFNKGIALASGEIIGIINSDDYYNLNALENVAEFYNAEKFDMMYADLRVFKDAKEFIKKAKKMEKRFSTLYWNHPTTFVHRRVYADIKYACNDIYDDLDFVLSVRDRGYKVCVLNRVLANFRLGGISNVRSFKTMLKRIKLKNSIYKKHGYKVYRLHNCLLEVGKFILSK